MIIRIKPTKGIMPKHNPYELPPDTAQEAENCLFGSGTLRPLVAGGVATNKSADDHFPAQPQTLFRYTGDRWLCWQGDVNVCRSPVADIVGFVEAGDSLYWTDPNVSPKPRRGENANILGPVGQKPASSCYPLGIPKPVAPSCSGTNGTTLEKQFRSYIYTYVSKFGEEGPPSDPSLEKVFDPGALVTVATSSHPDGYDHITKKRIYRSNTGSSASEYQFLVEIDIDTLSHPETTLDADLDEVCPSYTWFPPPANMVGLTNHPAGFMMGYYNTAASGVLCLSALFMPHAWVKQIVIDSPIVAIGIFGTSAIVVTNSFPIAVTGSDPESLTLERLESGEACTLKRGFVDMGYSCIYPGVSGLWGAGMGGVKLLTEDIMTKSEWDASYSPSATNSMLFAAKYNDLYIGFQEVGGFVLNTLTGDFYTHTITASAAYYEPKTGDLYYILASDNALYKWGVGPANTLKWRSKKYRLKAPSPVGVCRVLANYANGSITVKVYADGVVINGGGSGQLVSSEKPFRLPSGFRASVWEIEVSGTKEIREMILASSIAELVET